MDEKTYTLTLTREEVLIVNYSLYQEYERRSQLQRDVSMTREYKNKTLMLADIRFKMIMMLEKEEE